MDFYCNLCRSSHGLGPALGASTDRSRKCRCVHPCVRLVLHMLQLPPDGTSPACIDHAVPPADGACDGNGRQSLPALLARLRIDVRSGWRDPLRRQVRGVAQPTSDALDDMRTGRLCGTKRPTAASPVAMRACSTHEPPACELHVANAAAWQRRCRRGAQPAGTTPTYCPSR